MKQQIFIAFVVRTGLADLLFQAIPVFFVMSNAGTNIVSENRTRVSFYEYPKAEMREFPLSVARSNFRSDSFAFRDLDIFDSTSYPRISDIERKHLMVLIDCFKASDSLRGYRKRSSGAVAIERDAKYFRTFFHGVQSSRVLSLTVVFCGDKKSIEDVFQLLATPVDPRCITHYPDAVGLDHWRAPARVSSRNHEWPSVKLYARLERGSYLPEKATVLEMAIPYWLLARLSFSEIAVHLRASVALSGRLSELPGKPRLVITGYKCDMSFDPEAIKPSNGLDLYHALWCLRERFQLEFDVTIYSEAEYEDVCAALPYFCISVPEDSDGDSDGSLGLA